MRKRYYNQDDRGKARPDGFTKLHWSFFRSGLAQKVGPAAGWMLFALHSYADKSGRCFPSGRALAQRTGLSPTSITTAKRRLKKLGLIDYVIKREGKKNITHYQLRPLQADDALLKASAEESDNLPKDIRNYIQGLKEFIKKYRWDADYLRTQGLATIKLPNHVKQLLDKHGMSPANGRLFYALSLLDLLTQVSRTGNGFTVTARRNADKIASIVNNMLTAGGIMKVPYEDAFLAFVAWTKKSKASIDLNMGILPTLVREWLKGLRQGKSPA